MNFDVLIGKETEVKNKAELKSWFEDDKLYVGEYVKHKINQLDEPEVTLDKAFEKIAESYSMTKEEVWRRIEWFETHTEVLSQDWINKFTSPVDDEGRLYVWKSDLQNLLVPKQEEITEVEKEQKYYVINKEKELILGWSQSAYMTPCIEGYEYMKHNGRENPFQLTEQEIKDYDERYLLFALKVEEVEQCYMTQLQSPTKVNIPIKTLKPKTSSI